MAFPREFAVCPLCSEAMELGDFAIKSKWSSKLLFGLSEQCLFFKPSRKRKTVQLMTPDWTNPGGFCPRCRIAVIDCREDNLEG